MEELDTLVRSVTNHSGIGLQDQRLRDIVHRLGIEQYTGDEVTRSLSVGEEATALLDVGEGACSTTSHEQRRRHHITIEVLSEIDRFHDERTYVDVTITALDSAGEVAHDRLVLATGLSTGSSTRSDVELAISLTNLTLLSGLILLDVVSTDEFSVREV